MVKGMNKGLQTNHSMDVLPLWDGLCDARVLRAVSVQLLPTPNNVITALYSEFSLEFSAPCLLCVCSKCVLVGGV